MMPKKQSTAAQIARAVQKTTGQKYTAALRGAEGSDPIRALGAAFHRAGLAEVAQYMDAMAVRQDEGRQLYKVLSDAEDAYKEPSTPLSPSEVEACRIAYEKADTALRAHCEDTPFWEQGLLLRVFRALEYAAAVPDAGWLAAAAGDALCTMGLELAADIIRGMVLDARGLYGSGTAPARLARAAARVMAGASMIPTKGDEEWITCIDLLQTVVDLAEAAGAT